MFRFYETTLLEQFVEDLYKKHGILTPQQLNIEELARRLNVWVYYSELGSEAVEIKSGLGSINIYKNQSRARQWIDFLHELCHILRHSGDQRIMPEQFTRAQEAEADNFVLYAAMPISMISQLRLPVRKNDAIHFLASIFKVPLYLAKKRLEQIQHRLCQGKLLTETVKQVEDSDHVSNGDHDDMRETKVYAYYDSADDLIAPSQFIIHVDHETLHTQEELIFSIDGPFEVVEDGQLENFTDSKPVKFFDLDYTREGKVSLKLSHLASRYYNSANKFVIQKKDIEELLRFYGDEF
ncbi:ImmA/IrrE family metallo-endopeptidase [Priestia sp. BR_2]